MYTYYTLYVYTHVCIYMYIIYLYEYICTYVHIRVHRACGMRRINQFFDGDSRVADGTNKSQNSGRARQPHQRGVLGCVETRVFVDM